MHLAPLVVALALSVEPEPEQVDINTLDLEGLLTFETDVASSTQLTLRESPAIITVISRDEIVRVGARDLMDVLALVPGVGFGVDVQGVVGIGFRGLWGHEGKVLLLIDGQPMNELLYGTLQFGNHFPVELIERVEVIRGPGSVVYGGFAELAVIDVITRTAASLDGGAVAATYGRMRDTTGRWQASAGFGQRIGELEVVGQVAYGQGIRSDRIFVDANGDRFDMQDGSDLNPGFVNVGVRYRGLEARFIYDDYRTTEQSEFGELAVAPVSQTFRTARAEVRYAWHLADTLTLTPRVSLTWQKPWNTPDEAEPSFYNKTARRVTAGATALWAAHETLTVAAGADVWLDHASINADQADLGFNTTFDGENSVDYQNYVGFAEALWRTSIVNIQGGARVEHHSQFGASFVPRLALTRVFGEFHVKGLASRAFRAPVIENIATNPDIEPERT
ncbi:MAG TPA: TonB-dependent receptor plug domain-containing protein, partial [Myxococcota bacterium]|nr:TonB-dependent receptor plug domain-containing protein [Myxococcota bacterium]